MADGAEEEAAASDATATGVAAEGALVPTEPLAAYPGLAVGSENFGVVLEVDPDRIQWCREKEKYSYCVLYDDAGALWPAVPYACAGLSSCTIVRC